MAGTTFAACDFGAQSGRVILGTIGDGRLSLEEIHRFVNRPVSVHGHIYWDLLYLFQEMKNGLARIASHYNPEEMQGIGVDTWGVDFGLVARNGSILGNPVAYRDSRTDGMMDFVFEKIPRDEVYRETGIQFLQLNTLYQLASLVAAKSPLLSVAHKLLMMPDLFNYLLTGEVHSEYSIASTSQLLNARNGSWSEKILSALGISADLMPDIIPPGTVIGPLLPDIARETGLPAVSVIAPPCHDTASAVAAVPAQGKNWAYLSSGTWSLLGVEIDRPVISDRSLESNFTNEGGYGQTIRFLRNNMGMWLLERCRAEWTEKGKEISYPELLRKVEEAPAFRTLIDPDDPSFLNPACMPEAIRDFARRHGQPLPEMEGEFARCILESLALKYRFIMDQINSLRPQPVERLHIVGGGSQNTLLNQFTADAAGIPVLAGPVEATAIGNIAVQAIAKGLLADLSEARELIRKSFDLKEYEPRNRKEWENRYNDFLELYGGVCL